ncbi:hypothetical protein KQI65_05295 [bacterium]|nr:hypothetical protein [bacterium]
MRPTRLQASRQNRRSAFFFRRGKLPLFLTLLFCSMTLQAQEHPFYISFYYAPPPAGLSNAAPVYQGLAVSTDLGESWMNRGWITSAVNAIAVDPANSAHVLLGSDYGVLESGNAGEDWKLISGWDMPAVLDIEMDATGIWAATTEGIFLSKDGGASWNTSNAGLSTPDGTYVTQLLRVPGSMLIATNDGVYRSADKGASWRRSGLESQPLSGLQAHPKDPTHLLAWSEQDGIWVSTDGGRSWTNRNEGLRFPSVKCAVFDPRDRSTLLIGTRITGVMRSSDLGKTWEFASGGLTNLNINALLFDPRQPDRVYAGAENGSFISDSRGKTWQPFSIRLGYVSDLWMQ